jgi:hypothetical protein
MCSRLCFVAAVLAAPLLAQTPPPQSSELPPASIHEDEFTYRLPEDWRIFTPKTPAPAQQQKEEQKTPDLELKKGIACLQVPITARQGEPSSVVVVVTLPIGCYGQAITPDSLPALGAGAAEGLKQSFTVSQPLTASYALAGHRMWIERARGMPLGKTAPVYTLEIVCTVLKKEAVCWLAQAASESALLAFESTPVTLEGDAAPALVPQSLFLHAH